MNLKGDVEEFLKIDGNKIEILEPQAVKTKKYAGVREEPPEGYDSEGEEAWTS